MVLLTRANFCNQNQWNHWQGPRGRSPWRKFSFFSAKSCPWDRFGANQNERNHWKMGVQGRSPWRKFWFYIQNHVHASEFWPIKTKEIIESGLWGRSPWRKFQVLNAKSTSIWAICCNQHQRDEALVHGLVYATFLFFTLPYFTLSYLTFFLLHYFTVLYFTSLCFTLPYSTLLFFSLFSLLYFT